MGFVVRENRAFASIEQWTIFEGIYGSLTASNEVPPDFKMRSPSVNAASKAS